MYILTVADGFIGKHFKKSLDGVVEVEIDSDTKQLPTSRTKNLETEYFLRSNVPQ